MSLKETFVEELENVLNMVGGKDGSKDKLYITRKNVSDNLTKGEKGFGFISFIRSDQAASGRYSGLSVKVNPGEKHYRISLDIGNDGFGYDYQLATLPGTRRRFLNLQKDIISYTKGKNTIKSFCSLDYGDDAPKRQLKELEKEYKDDNIDSHAQDLFVAFVDKPMVTEEVQDQTYSKKDFWLVFKAVAAIYAELRQWSNKGETKVAGKFINALHGDYDETQDTTKCIQNLLDNRQYVVLQGAPGTGKTYLMNQLSRNYESFFTQFHAETTYSDFVGGYKPVTDDKGQLSYQYFEGPLLEAIRAAKEDGSQKVLLMIDEINRANLSNVLGEAFYLFEKQTGQQRRKVELGDPQNPIEIEALPTNLYVIATMNTADRSLAVVDFALRRRFAWFTMYPHSLNSSGNQVFHSKQFEAMDRIFQTYATSEELMLEPGQAYYLTDSENADDLMKDRMEYELLPLIREYLDNGLMIQAKDALNQFFVDELNQTLFI
ncbi:5-methylcytosine-specific restriction enzyme B [Secundilactobacillus pentosiphilus]|uniref:5-methylcytosine-specific restriction enzyme B n=1 Tax=Secundilactobacillus pentosiphilus TaxID=1714682 RepID=A0A1Z5IPM9_9LACO|nr:AAA family ATPase [Secundilactobacillus pentosiphilus]GAX03703.1 5-methylcytosine-specific restriction enzyme B [Secundilactobacillus pentosiphilus]